VGARGQAVSVDLEDLSQITRNFQDAAVPAITGMSGTIATVSSAIRKRMRMMPERAVTAGLDAVTKIGQLVSPKGGALCPRAIRRQLRREALAKAWASSP
jgi:hypothetical protein